MTVQIEKLQPANDTGLNAVGGVDYERLVLRGQRLRAEAILAATRMVHRYIKSQVLRPLQCWRKERLRYGQLMALDNRTLKDIGLSRSDIRTIAGGVWVGALKKPTSVSGARSKCIEVNGPEKQHKARPDQCTARLAA